MKSERLKKLENELKDLENWLRLDLVPKKDIEKHQTEIKAVRTKIEEERQRLQFLKESGDMEEYAAPKKSQAKQIYDTQSMPDVGGQEETSDVGVEDMESTTFEPDHTTLFDIEEGVEEQGSQEHDNDDDPYSDENRWRRARKIIDPEQDDW